MHDTLSIATPPRDNLLGICHALGKTFGFDPIYLRIVLMIGLLVDFEWTLIAYAIGGVAVLAATLLARDPGMAAVSASPR